MENGPFIVDFPIKTSIYKGFSMAMLNNQMVLGAGSMIFLAQVVTCILRTPGVGSGTGGGTSPTGVSMDQQETTESVRTRSLEKLILFGRNPSFCVCD